jgi:hypothetical protein
MVAKQEALISRFGWLFTTSQLEFFFVFLLCFFLFKAAEKLFCQDMVWVFVFVVTFLFSIDFALTGWKRSFIIPFCHYMFALSF